MHQTGPNRTKQDHTGPNMTKQDQTGPTQDPHRTKQDQTGSNTFQTGPNTFQTGPNRTKQDEAGPNRTNTRPNRTKQDQTGPTQDWIFIIRLPQSCSKLHNGDNANGNKNGSVNARMLQGPSIWVSTFY